MCSFVFLAYQLAVALDILYILCNCWWVALSSSFVTKMTRFMKLVDISGKKDDKCASCQGIIQKT